MDTALVTQPRTLATTTLRQIDLKYLGFSQDCAWEKRFSCGEQPKTEWSGWCDAMTPGSALDDQLTALRP